MRHIYYCLLMISVSLIKLPNLYANEQQNLHSLQQSILEQEKKLIQQKEQRVKLIAGLKEKETTIANLLASLAKLDKELDLLVKDITTLNLQIAELENNQKEQRVILAKQLEDAFKLGKTNSIELIFAGDESERNERVISYYGYINAERQHRIQALTSIQQKLISQKELLEQKHQIQQALLNKQKKERDQLVDNRKDRQKTIAALDKSMQLNQQKLDELRENEKALQAQITKAKQKNNELAKDEAEKAARIKVKQKEYNYNPTKQEKALMARVSGIGKPRHSLTWPISGDLLYQFGEQLQGELRWKGLVIKAKEGTKVKAIADGRVILASWLQGYGFIVALDHGKGDMTLYGYNQRVLVEVGDNIESGQDIALVGTTGGQRQAALYFEIRRDGQALDPSAWLKK